MICAKCYECFDRGVKCPKCGSTAAYRDLTAVSLRSLLAWVDRSMTAAAKCKDEAGCLRANLIALRDHGPSVLNEGDDLEAKKARWANDGNAQDWQASTIVTACLEPTLAGALAVFTRQVGRNALYGLETDVAMLKNCFDNILARKAVHRPNDPEQPPEPFIWGRGPLVRLRRHEADQNISDNRNAWRWEVRGADKQLIASGVSASYGEAAKDVERYGHTE